MVCAGIEDRSEYDAAREILVVMGVYFQAQDDFLDAFGSHEQIGKIGTDIQDKKCGWLFVNAYNGMVDAKDKAYLDKHYGQPRAKWARSRRRPSRRSTKRSASRRSTRPTRR